MGKLGLKNRHQIASFARKNGLVGKFPTSKEN
jgi:DNA-binding CsgD family transcriptional regulator